MRSSFSRIVKLVVVSFLLSSLLHAFPNVVSTAPMRGLYIPLFDVNGVKVWEIAGSSGDIQRDSSILVSDMLINCCGADNDVTFTVESKLASVVPSSSSVIGSGEVVIGGKNFTAVADDWSLDGGGRRFVANKNVRVVFSDGATEFAVP
jgi:hypothetical protein